MRHRLRALREDWRGFGFPVLAVIVAWAVTIGFIILALYGVVAQPAVLWLDVGASFIVPVLVITLHRREKKIVQAREAEASKRRAAAQRDRDRLAGERLGYRLPSVDIARRNYFTQAEYLAWRDVNFPPESQEEVKQEES